MHTVAQLAPNGGVGSAVLPHLVRAHQDGKIKLVLLHRPGRPPKDVPDGIELRELDISDYSKLDDAVKGVEVFL